LGRRVFRLLIVLALLTAVCVYLLPKQRIPIGNVSAVQVSGTLGVYWDVNCSETVDSIAWGTVAVGETKNVVVYVRNERTETVFLIVTASNFVPTGVSDYLHFAYTCVGHKLEPNSIVRVTQGLSVSPDTRGVSEFSFNVNFEAKVYVEGDLNGDGLVNIQEAIVFALAYSSTAGDAKWNPDADFTEDGTVNILDALYLAARFS
jgi:hypothetical protein